MDDNNKTYRMPAGFNPCHAADALLGLATAIRHSVMEGPLSESSLSDEEYFSLCGLVTLLHEQAHALHGYLRDIENRTTIRLPRSEADFEKLSMNPDDYGMVKEPPPVYVSRH